ncbi:BACON domain-containing protein [Pontiellaceae bacterium B12219]|nr:BACON domain-containing protein [Pontiellaceae bacterium B12219]
MKQNALPYLNSASQSFTDSSTYAGDDGFTRYLSSTSGAGQEWYILVLAETGSTWNLLSGDVYAEDLGALAAGSGSGSGLDEVPPEGIRYFKTTIPVAAYAWRLWLQDAAGTSTLNTPFYVRKGLAPHPSSTSYYDRTRTGQGLLVPDYVVPGEPEYYYVGIPGAPGDQFQLDSRQQEIVNTTYNNTLVGQSASGYHFKTYRIPVPPEQIAWEVTVEPTAGTNPNLAVRLDKVPNAFNNDAFSELSSTTESDSITLVPASLSDGSYYVTVYGDADFSFNLRNREPVITQIDFSSSTLNDDPTRVGWRYFAVSDIGQQLGQLGWLLELSNHIPDSEIAIRRNFVPGRWNYRQNGSSSVYQSSHNDQTSLLGYLQDPNHEADVWYVGIYSPDVALGAFTLDSSPILPAVIPVDGHTSSGIQVPPKTWQFYNLDIPAQTNGQDIIGWELRLTDWAGNNPNMVIRRDQLPDSVSSYPYWRSSGSWPSGYQWASSGGDWSAYSRDETNTRTYPQYLISMGMDRPLEPGSYYIGFYNNSASVTSTYSFASSAIGSGMTYDPQPIAFNGGSAAINNLAPRGVQYFSVEVPTNSSSWKVRLENTVGESSLFIRKDYVPTYSMYQSPTYSPDQNIQYLPTFRKSGDEHYTLLPAGGETTIPGGTYYLMVVSEGQSPSGNAIGTGTSSATLHSLGEVTPLNLGTLPVSGNLTHSNMYDAGETELYRFSIPAGILGVQLRLENVLGTPEMNLRTDASLPNGMNYGLYSGYNGQYADTSIITVPNVSAGTWSLMIGDSSTAAALENGGYRLVIEDLIPPDLNVDAALNTNGSSNVAGGTLIDDERAFYRVDVPAEVDGVPMVGWYLTTSVSQGDAQVRVRKDLLPEGNSNIYQTPFRSDALMVVPPFLSPGTWYVEVKGVGATTYTLASTSVVPERSWTMPEVGEALSTPGVSSPLFGDSGVNDAGLPLPVDQGVDLNNGFYHVYAVTVPEENAGLLRTQLEAISGNPNLYIRAGNVPTLDHNNSGNGTLYDRYLNGTANTEYGNWVPYDGRYADALEPGIWYLMVKAEGTGNARYRLKVSGGNVYADGNVQALSLDGGSFSGQLLADNDWRHYRVEVPTNAPVNWELTFTQTSGNVDLFIRDTLPSGHWNFFSDSTGYIRDWNQDLKNRGSARPNFPDTGTHTVNMPPLRPGHVYYLSFLAKSDASFSVSSAVSGGTIPVYEKLDFETGAVSTIVPAGASITYQVDVPADAVRWIHSTTNSSALNVYLEQGTLPSQTSSDHWYRTAGSYTLNQYLLNENGWPWLPNYTYYFTVVNPTANPEPFDLVMQGSTTPEIPLNLSASDGNYADYVRLQWLGISGVSAFEVWRNTVNDASTATNLSSGFGSTSYNDYSADPGQLYHYWISVAGVTNTAWFSVPNTGWRPGIGNISPSQRMHAAAGGSGTIDVTAPAGTLWTATEGLNWITIQSGTSGTNNGSVAYSVSAYAGTTARTGSVTVASQTFLVIQDAFELAGNVQATDGDYEDRTEITWDFVPGATTYYLYRNTTSDSGSASYIGNTAANVFNDISGAAGQVYTYWVRPYNDGGVGGFSLPESGYRSAGIVSGSWITAYFPGGYPGDGVDSDGDGFSNIEEFIADTVPTNGLSYFRIEDQHESPSGFIIHWNAASGRVYAVNWIDGLTNSLVPLTNNIAYPQGSYTDSVHAADDAGFYRLEVELE